jgi:O-phosphoseryl-tRNA(Cys) synthetase
VKKIRLESLEHLVGVMDEEELVKFAFEQIDVMVKQANEVLKDKGTEMEYPEILVLNGKEYQKPKTF